MVPRCIYLYDVIVMGAVVAGIAAYLFMRRYQDISNLVSTVSRN